MGYPEHIIRRAIELKEGRSAGAVLRALEKEFHEEVDSLNVRTILRWANTKPELLVKPSSHIETGQEAKLPRFDDNWKEHNERLAGVAASLLDNGLIRVMKDVTKEGEVYYYFHDEDGILRKCTQDDLAWQLDENHESALDKHTDWVFMECFCPHLYAEFPDELKSKGLSGIIDEQPYELVELLRLLAARKTFKGSCPVCKDW